jgi:hypothetical protein
MRYHVWEGLITEAELFNSVIYASREWVRELVCCAADLPSTWQLVLFHSDASIFHALLAFVEARIEMV